MAITAAMPAGTGLDLFGKEFPTRTFDVGIAEQHAVTFAAGLASEGYKPFCAIYSTFLQRAYDQVVHDVAIQNLPVRFALDRAGLVGADGPTHAGSFDVAFLGCLPNMVADGGGRRGRARPHGRHRGGASTAAPSRCAIPAARAWAWTCPSRACRSRSARAACCGRERAVALLSYGTRLAECLKAADELAARGLSTTVADARFAKPLDTAWSTPGPRARGAGDRGGGLHRRFRLLRAAAPGRATGLLDQRPAVRAMVLPDVYPRPGQARAHVRRRPASTPTASSPRSWRRWASRTRRGSAKSLIA